MQDTSAPSSVTMSSVMVSLSKKVKRRHCTCRDILVSARLAPPSFNFSTHTAVSKRVHLPPKQTPRACTTAVALLVSFFPSSLNQNTAAGARSLCSRGCVLAGSLARSLAGVRCPEVGLENPLEHPGFSRIFRIFNFQDFWIFGFPIFHFSRFTSKLNHSLKPDLIVCTW